MSAMATVVTAATGAGSGLLQLIITGILSGSVVGAAATLITSRAVARKTGVEARALDAKLPAEVDSVVVQGAEAAVLTMKAALDSASTRLAQVERERDEDRKRIAELEAKVRKLEAKVNAAERALGDARQAGAALREELESFIRAQDRRR